MRSHEEARASKIGQTFNYLTCKSYVGGRRGFYLFDCVCGNIVNTTWSKVKYGQVKSCGCWKQGRPAVDDPLVPHRAVWHRYRLSALRRGKEWNLTVEQVAEIIEKNCSYCDLPPSTNMKLSAHPDFRYTGIDRVDNGRGYEKDNVVPCCEACNNSKRTMSLADWKAWIARVYNKSVQRTDFATEDWT